MVYVPRDDHGRLLRVEYQPFVGITDNQYTDLPEAARNKLDGNPPIFSACQK